MYYSHLRSNYGYNYRSVYIFQLTSYSILSIFQGIDVILFYTRKIVMTNIDAFTQRMIIADCMFWVSIIVYGFHSQLSGYEVHILTNVNGFD